MKISVDPKQREVFLEDGALLLEEILTSDIQEKILAEADQMKDPLGRDLWRKSATMKKMAGNRPIVNVVSQLLGEKLIRLGFDQYLPKIDGGYADWIQGTGSLRDISSFRGEMCAVLIPLTGVANALFVKPEWKLELGEWINLDVPHYLVLYTTLKAQYVLNKQDPASADMVRLGYNNGDHLTEEINPVIHK